MKTVPFYDLKVTNGFWAERQETNLRTTLWAVYDRFKETGRIETMDCKDHGIKPHCFWGSDVFKWIEGTAYVLEKEKDPRLLQAVNEIVNMVESGCSADGYYNSFFNSPVIEEERFTNRDRHELYSFGHMFEAGVALHHATGDEKLLNLCKRAADLIDRIFREEESAAFVTPGHEEIELALIRLYHATNEPRYLKLAEFFLHQRGNNPKDLPLGSGGFPYEQAHLPVVEQTEAVGHAVRAVYLYCALADLAAEQDNKELFMAADRLFTDIYERKMYITGGIGSLAKGEAFSVPYHLPNSSAYAETCAALGLALFCRRLYAAKPDGRYGDAAERALFNGMISGLSLSGDAFFYENPLEIDLARQDLPRTHLPITQRKKVFSCSCCPPNLVRLIPSIADFIYTYDDRILYVHQYIANQGIADGKEVSIQTKYPANGKVTVSYSGDKKLALRRPTWCKTIHTNAPYREEQGYLYFDTNAIEIEFVMEPVFYEASGSVHENTGRIALLRGPIVYCLEGQDQPYPLFDLKVDPAAPVTVAADTFGGYPILRAKGVYAPGPAALYAPLTERKSIPCDLTFIPYYTFANRGEDDMQVWVLKA